DPPGAPARPARRGVPGPVTDEHVPRTGALLLPVLLLLRAGHGDRDQRRSHGDHITGLAVQLGDHSAVRTRNLHRCFGGFHLGNGLFRFDLLARADAPADQFRLDEALAEIGKLEHLGRTHAAPSPSQVMSGSSFHCSRHSASSTRSTFGRYACSSFGGGYGTSNPLTRNTGAASEWKQRSCTRAAISAPTPAKPAASLSTTQRPVLLTAAVIVSSSSGTRLRRSTT